MRESGLQYYKWFIEESPKSRSSAGFILFSRSLNTFYFFTNEERLEHKNSHMMRETKNDPYAQKVLEKILRK